MTSLLVTSCSRRQLCVRYYWMKFISWIYPFLQSIYISLIFLLINPQSYFRWKVADTNLNSQFHSLFSVSSDVSHKWRVVDGRCTYNILLVYVFTIFLIETGNFLQTSHLTSDTIHLIINSFKFHISFVWQNRNQ